MVYEESSNDINSHENTKETIIKTSPCTVDYINNITKRSLDIRSEIENLINQTSFLSEPHKKEEGRNSTKPDTNPEEHLGKKRSFPRQCFGTS